jgi:putative DNA primase/helicase
MTKNIISIVAQATDDIAPAFSEEELALKFAASHASDLRYVAAWNRWLRWDGQLWRWDQTRDTFTLARAHCRSEAAKLNKPKEAKAMASARTRAAVVTLAGEDERLKATIDQWDADPWILNTPGGVIDLRSGASRNHRPEDYMTKITACSPGGECPLWREFLTRVTNDDQQMQNYLQRVAGYSLTGITNEHALFFLYGRGGNGKGVYVNTIGGIMGEYRTVAPIETFTASHGDRHPTELARLRGARLVTATETEEGRPWAESKIKMLTGGESKIAARFMREDFFEFEPQFKLLIAGNHKPGLRSVDEAIRRRMNLLPFLVIIPDNEKDLELGEKLKREWSGILQWMIEGCLAWQKGGLNPPPVVTNATKDYLEAEDAIQAWLDECCIIDSSKWTAVGDLFDLWKRWTEANGEFTGSARRFSQSLVDRGFEPVRRDKRGFLGLTTHYTLVCEVGCKACEAGIPLPEEPKWQEPL